MAATQTEVIRAEECALCAELETWCGVQGLPFISADDLRRREDITTAAQRDWLEDYCARWDAWETRAGMDSDSIKALNTYNECCKTGETLRKFPREVLTALREALQNY